MKRALPFALAMLATPAMAADKMTVLLDWFINPDHGPLIVAEELGYFAEQDLEVEIVAPADPADPPKLAAAGKAELAIGYQPQLHLQIHEGLPLKRVGTLVATPLNCLLVLDDSPIQSPGDLKGKKVGFSLADIKEMLDLYDLKDGQATQLRVALERFESQIDLLKQQKQDIEQAIEELTRTMDVVAGMLKERETAEQQAAAM